MVELLILKPEVPGSNPAQSSSKNWIDFCLSYDLNLNWICLKLVYSTQTRSECMILTSTGRFNSNTITIRAGGTS